MLITDPVIVLHKHKEYSDICTTSVEDLWDVHVGIEGCEFNLTMLNHNALHTRTC